MTPITLPSCQGDDRYSGDDDNTCVRPIGCRCGSYDDWGPYTPEEYCCRIAWYQYDDYYMFLHYGSDRRTILTLSEE